MLIREMVTHSPEPFEFFAHRLQLRVVEDVVHPRRLQVHHDVAFRAGECPETCGDDSGIGIARRLVDEVVDAELPRLSWLSRMRQSDVDLGIVRVFRFRRLPAV